MATFDQMRTLTGKMGDADLRPTLAEDIEQWSVDELRAFYRASLAWAGVTQYRLNPLIRRALIRLRTLEGR